MLFEEVGERVAERDELRVAVTAEVVNAAKHRLDTEAANCRRLFCKQ